MVSSWPQIENEQLHIDKLAVDSVGIIQNIIRAVRNARSEYNVEAGKKVSAFLRCADAQLLNRITEEKSIISLLARIDEGKFYLQNFDSKESVEKCAHLVIQDGIEVFLPLLSFLDKDKERARLGKQTEKLKKELQGLEGRLNSPGFVEKAPESVIEEVKGQLQDKKMQLSVIEKSLIDLENLHIDI